MLVDAGVFEGSLQLLDCVVSSVEFFVGLADEVLADLVFQSLELLVVCYDGDPTHLGAHAVSLGVVVVLLKVLYVVFVGFLKLQDVVEIG